MVIYNPSESEEKALSVEEVTVVTAIFDHFRGYEEAYIPLGADLQTFNWHQNRIKNTGDRRGNVFCEVAELDESNNIIEVICRANTELDANECALFWADFPGKCELVPSACNVYTQRGTTKSAGGIYHFGMKTWSEDEPEPLYTDINLDKVRTWSLKVHKMTCDEPTEHFANGCIMLLDYDEDKTGTITSDEIAKVLKDYDNGLLNDGELMSLWICSGTTINDLCPGCYEIPAHDTTLTIDIVDATGNPITTAFVGDTVYISGQLSDTVTGELLTGAVIKLLRNGVDTGLTDVTNNSGVYSIPYPVVSEDAPSVRFKTVFEGA